jgi:hypothetical protein
MGPVQPRTGNITQHAGEAAAASEVWLLLLLDLRTRTTLPLAAPLRVGDGRERNDANRDPCREHGGDQFPHNRSPKKSFDTPSIKEGVSCIAS